MMEIEKIANELKQMIDSIKINCENFSLEIAVEKAKDEEMRNEIQYMIRSRAEKVYADDEYVVYIAEKRFENGWGEKTYHAVWICGIDKTQPSGFWVHRLQWREEFEEFDWKNLRKEKIRERMGFTTDIGESFYVEKTWKKIVGDGKGK